MDKATKIQAGYAKVQLGLESTKGVSCSQCQYFLSNEGKCTLVQGPIRDVDSCNLWVNNGPLNLSYISGKEAREIVKSHNKLTKAQAGYVCAIPQKLRPEKGRGFGCATCIIFHENESMCGIVGGKVSPFACCNLHTFKGDEIDFSYASGKDIESKIKGRIQIQDIEDLMCE